MVKSNVPPDVGEEEIVTSEPEKQENEAEQAKPVGEDASKKISPELSVVLERIQTQINALNEVREANNERFSRVSEQIGEIRTMVVENEKGMHDIELKATTASDLVRDVQPETLSAEVKKVDSKVDIVKAAVEAGKSMNENIMDELKGIKSKMSIFQGTDAVLKLNEEIKKELINVQKIKMLTESHANKVEQVFIEIQKNFSDFQKLENDLENIASANSNLEKQFGGLKIKLEAVPSKKEIEALRKEMNSNTISLQAQSKEIQKNKNLISVLKSIEVRLAELIENTNTELSDIKQENLKIKKDIDDICSFLEKLADKINKKPPQNEIDSIKKQVKTHDRELIGLLSVVEMIEKKLVQKNNRK